MRGSGSVLEVATASRDAGPRSSFSGCDSIETDAGRIGVAAHGKALTHLPEPYVGQAKPPKMPGLNSAVLEAFDLRRQISPELIQSLREPEGLTVG
ncbi:hypothetical protein [Variovorax sp. V116]|uniref:hypothetical protein n=1 Tax=Variovorax sp. V116 TaxID=3065953 RepID=UPI0034E8E3A9